MTEQPKKGFRIVKFYQDTLPDIRLIGRKFGESDRDEQQTFATIWNEWLNNGTFDQLEKLGPHEKNENSYMGAMRNENGVFEYWIGMFFPRTVEAPSGFESIDIPAAKLAIAWYKGEDTPQLYQGCHEVCIARAKEEGLKPKEHGWFIEKYNMPRYSEPDENGEVILDYCIFLE